MASLHSTMIETSGRSCCHLRRERTASGDAAQSEQLRDSENAKILSTSPTPKRLEAVLKIAVDISLVRMNGSLIFRHPPIPEMDVARLSSPDPWRRVLTLVRTQGKKKLWQKTSETITKTRLHEGCATEICQKS